MHKIHLEIPSTDPACGTDDFVLFIIKLSVFSICGKFINLYVFKSLV